MTDPSQQPPDPYQRPTGPGGVPADPYPGAASGEPSPWSGDGSPGPQGKPPRPSSVRTLLIVMVVGGVLALVAMALGLAGLDAAVDEGLAEAGNVEGVDAATLETLTRSFGAVAVVLSGVVSAGLWFLFAWLFSRGSARVFGTVLGAVNAVGTLFALVTAPDSLTLALSLVQLLVIVAALVLLWRRPTGDWFAAMKAARSRPAY